MTSTHLRLLIALGALSLAGCLRQTAGPAAAPTGAGKPSSAKDESVAEVETPGASFVLDGEPFCFVGTNNYYLSFKPHEMVDDVLQASKALGLKVVRIWANIDKGSLDGSVPSVDGPGDKEGVYFQYWDPVAKRPVYNDGATGLEHLDYVLDRAKKLDLKLMLVLTNNWREFGGMDQYLTWYGQKQHHLFYTDPKVIRAYKDWAAHLVHRKNTLTGVVYRDDPTIFGWELANEPRCINFKDFDVRSGWTTATLTGWADDVSNYLHSIDPKHIVSVGDEGMMKKGGGFGYDGSDGADHEALLALKGIDFGTFHLYPDSWGQSVRWGSQWIDDHLAAARAAGKPTLLEEYGIIATRKGDTGPVVESERRDRAYPRWHEIMNKRGGNAALFWMLAGVDAKGNKYPDYDHFTLYGDDPMSQTMKAFGADLATKGAACRLFRKYAPAGGLPKSPFVTTSPPPGRPQAMGSAALTPSG
jgi:mannan endo-1,4-beta-mannosidase